MVQIIITLTRKLFEQGFVKKLKAEGLDQGLGIRLNRYIKVTEVASFCKEIFSIIPTVDIAYDLPDIKNVLRLSVSKLSLTIGQRFAIPLNALAQPRVNVNLPLLQPTYWPQVFNLNSKVLFHDGELVATLVELTDDCAIYQVTEGSGALIPGNDIHFVGAEIKAPKGLTPQDRETLRALQALPQDQRPKAVWLSFVRGAQQILEVHAIAPEFTIVAKFESLESIENDTEIFNALKSVSGYACIAEGDGTLAWGRETVPLVRLMLLEKARLFGVKVICATHLLRSMIESPTPSVSDCHNVVTAVRNGAVGLMLSDEITKGMYPLEAVRWARLLADRAANVQDWNTLLKVLHKQSNPVQCAEDPKAKCSLKSE